MSCTGLISVVGGVATKRRGVELAIKTSRVRLQVDCVATMGKLFTPMCLCHQAV